MFQLFQWFYAVSYQFPRLKKTRYRRTDGLTDQPTDRQTDRPSYRDAWMHRKMQFDPCLPPYLNFQSPTCREHIETSKTDIVSGIGKVTDTQLSTPFFCRHLSHIYFNVPINPIISLTFVVKKL